MSDFHDRKVGRDRNYNNIYADVKGHRRTYCRTCGIALDVRGGCACCKPLKGPDVIASDVIYGSAGETADDS